MLLTTDDFFMNILGNEKIIYIAMKTLGLFVSALFAGSLWVAAQTVEEKKLDIIIENPSTSAKTDEPVVINLHKWVTGFTVKSAIVTDSGVEIPSQLDDMDFDMRADELAFVVDIPARGKKTVQVILSSRKSDKTYKPRVYAQMLFRTHYKDKYEKGYSIYAPGSSDTYTVLMHHGIAFESELVAYRIYYNQKQTTDLYGKFNKGLEIEESLFYPTDEQLKREFGDDIILVRGSCGAGTLRGWDGTQATDITPVAFRGQRLIASGPVRTIADAEVKAWEYQGKELNMINRYTLYAGHRDVQVDAIFDCPLDNETFATGVQNILGISEKYSDHEGLVASWGTDWPTGDTIKYTRQTVGLATYIPKHLVVKEAADKENYLYVIQAPEQTSFRYYTAFTSRKEKFGYPTSKEWFEYAKEWKAALEKPCKVTVMPR